MKYELDTLTLFTVSKILKKKEEEKNTQKTHTQGESEESSIPKAVLLFFLSFVFGAFKACKK